MFSVRRKIEVTNLIFLKVRDLLRRPTGERLAPDIVGPTRIRVQNRLAIDRPSDSGAKGVKVKDLDRLAALGRQQRRVPTAPIVIVFVGDQLSVGRDDRLAGIVLARQFNRRAALKSYPLKR